MAETVQSFPGLYPLGSGQAQTLLNGTSVSSFVLNTRDLASPGDPDYVLVGPGSQVWCVGYSIRASRPSPFPQPTDPLGLTLQLEGSYDPVIPLIFGTEQRLILPVYAGVHHFQGWARVESPIVQCIVINVTGNDLEVSFQFWGKAV